MSFIAEIQACQNSKLRPTTTRVTNALGQTYHESKNQDGSFEIECRLVNSNGLFMVIDVSPDEKLHHVLDGVYIGSQDAAHNLSGLQECQITHVLNVASGVRNVFPEQYKYFNIELLDVPETDVRSVFAHTNDFIQRAIAENGRVLVHCNAGVSRSSCIVLAYLLGVRRMAYDEAYKLVKVARPNIRPNTGFVHQLKAYANETLQNGNFESMNPIS